MSADQIYCWITVLAMIGLIQSSLENLAVALKHPAMYKHSLNQGALSSSRVKWFRWFYNAPGVWLLSVSRVLIAVLLLVASIYSSIHFVLPLALLLIDAVAYPRWRFFPTSESALQRVFLFTLTVHAFFDQPTISIMGLSFIAFHLCLVYLVAGLQKLKDPSWKDGSSLKSYVESSAFTFSKNTFSWKWLGYLVILWEITFPLSLSGGKIMWFYLLSGVLFHVFLSVKNGFNFFLWAFLSGYPAIKYVSENTDQIISLIFK